MSQSCRLKADTYFSHTQMVSGKLANMLWDIRWCWDKAALSQYHRRLDYIVDLIKSYQFSWRGSSVSFSPTFFAIKLPRDQGSNARTTSCNHVSLGPVHTMPDKFENATLLLRIRLPSTLIRIKRATKTELFENALQSGTIWKRYFFVLVWTENFLYPQHFEYADIILSCNLSSQVINMAKNDILKFWK